MLPRQSDFDAFDATEVGEALLPRRPIGSTTVRPRFSGDLSLTFERRINALRPALSPTSWASTGWCSAWPKPVRSSGSPAPSPTSLSPAVVARGPLRAPHCGPQSRSPRIAQRRPLGQIVVHADVVHWQAGRRGGGLLPLHGGRRQRGVLQRIRRVTGHLAWQWDQ
jgi:hypothetical protein